MHKTLLLLVLTCGAVNAENLSFQESLSLTTDRISALDVINGAGDIDISSHNGPDIQVSATITSKKYRSLERLKEVFERDMVFDLYRESEYAVLRGHSRPDLFKSPDIQIHLDIQIPKHLDVDIEDGSGSIRVTGLAGFLKIEDGSGAVHIGQISNGVEIEDGSGDIHVNKVMGSIDIEDGSGQIDITDSDGDVNIDDGSGEITLTNVRGKKDIEDGSGDIALKNSSGDVDIDDGSGDIKLSDISGSVALNDGSGSIYIDALSGPLDIKNAGSGKVIIDDEDRTKEF